MDSYDLIREEEKKYIREVDRTKGVNKWYLIPSKWLDKWHLFVVEKGELPGKINMEEFKKIRVANAVKDFRGINEQVWRHFVGNYGLIGEEIVKPYIPKNHYGVELEMSRELGKLIKKFVNLGKMGQRLEMIEQSLKKKMAELEELQVELATRESEMEPSLIDTPVEDETKPLLLLDG